MSALAQSEHFETAFRSTRAAKNVFMILLIAALVIQLLAFVLVEWIGVVDPFYAPDKAVAAETLPDDVSPAVPSATLWQASLRWLLPATKFLGLVAAMLAVLAILFAVKISLLGRYAGIPWFLSSFFWSLVLLAMVAPWQQILRGGIATGAFYSFAELVRQGRLIHEAWGAENVTTLDLILYYARFLAFPILTLAVWALVTTKFSKGFSASLQPVGEPTEPLPATESASAEPAEGGEPSQRGV